MYISNCYLYFVSISLSLPLTLSPSFSLSLSFCVFAVLFYSFASRYTLNFHDLLTLHSETILMCGWTELSIKLTDVNENLNIEWPQWHCRTLWRVSNMDLHWKDNDFLFVSRFVSGCMNNNKHRLLLWLFFAYFTRKCNKS